MMGALPLQGHLNARLSTSLINDGYRRLTPRRTARRTSRAVILTVGAMSGLVCRIVQSQTSTPSSLLPRGSSHLSHGMGRPDRPHLVHGVGHISLVWMRADAEQKTFLKLSAAIAIFLAACTVFMLFRLAVGRLQRPARETLEIDSKPKKDLYVRFMPKVSCISVPDLTNLPESTKAKCWWTEEEFAEFLRVRIQIGKAYKAAAKKMGIDVGGAFPPIPELAHESRRGLGLGRKAERARHRDRYLAAVLEEQERQRERQRQSNPAEPEVTGSAHGIDHESMEALSRVAQRFSEKDRKYAHTLAVRYFEQDERDRLEEEKHRHRRNSGVAIFQEASTPRAPKSPENLDASKGTGSWSIASLLHESEHHEADLNDEDQPVRQENGRRLPMAAKGHGLSRDKLRQVGLTANGHHLSKAQKVRWRTQLSEPVLDPTSGAETSDGEATSAQGDEDDGDKWAALEYGTPSEYRNWRLAAVAGEAGNGKSAVPASPFQRPSHFLSEYGNPREYNQWRRRCLSKKAFAYESA